MNHKIIAQREVPQQIKLSAAIHPVLQRVYAARNVTTDDDLDYSLSALLPFNTLTGIEPAITLLRRAIQQKKRMLVVADFDTDGATSCALAIRGLTQMGAEDVVYVVPNRFEFGYGLTPEIVDCALEYDPELLITVDNGISSIDGVKRAKRHGLEVLITDHHLPGASLPEADAIINPQLPGDRFPSKHLAGVGVVFYMLLALRASLKALNWFENNQITYPNLARFLDLVALGTIADVVPLDKNNRIMVAHGLKLIRRNKCVAGIAALLNRAGCESASMNASDLGFSVAPRLNAAGRLTDMSSGIECLLTDNRSEADKIAEQLNNLNNERRQLQTDMQQQAMYVLEDCLVDNDGAVPAGICLFNQAWHQGIVGIVAARIKENFNRPVIAFARQDDEVIKGSARSISGLHIKDVLEDMARREPGLIISFGGHAMAAGVTILESDFEKFNDCFSTAVKEKCNDETLKAICFTDGELSGNDLSLELAKAIQAAGPWGQLFPEPLFEGRFRVIDKRIVGENHLKLKLKTEDNDNNIDAIAFNITDDSWSSGVNKIRTTYRLGINNFRGSNQLQLVIDYLEPLE